MQNKLWLYNSMKTKNQNIKDKKKILRETNHLTRPPRLEGVVKNTKMNPVKKKRKNLS